MSALEVHLRLPDVWQQKALRALQEGKDVVVDAPTGAGKTYIFELFVENGHLPSNAVYTVPTRALANDKLRDWRQRAWRVGIATGDIAENLDAPVVVATLETQKYRFLRGEGPGLLVIDEYQMLGDHSRGVNYELALALAPESTQLLLMSGSVANPQAVAEWLRRLGREVVLVRNGERPVPLEEIDAEAIPGRVPASVEGFWPRVIAKALKYEMAPLLAFAPRRRAAEQLALQLARMLPEEEPLILTSEQRRLAGDTLARLLRSRIAFHHSGLDYAQRAGLVEPLAKAGQLRVVVATMGLSSGINFSMRSVIVTDREYRAGERAHLLRPDELLQMFGRAGRRGLDKKGYIVVAPGKPRFTEARPLELKRSNQLDWPSLLAVMEAARRAGRPPIESARAVADSLFSQQRLVLGLADFRPDPRIKARPPTRVQTVEELQTPDGNWERLRAAQRRRLDECLIYDRAHWRPALKVAASLAGVQAGTLCRLHEGPEYVFGREVPVARFGRDASEGDLVLTRWASRALQQWRSAQASRQRTRRAQWTLDALERELLPALPQLTQGGRFHAWRERDEILYARLAYGEAETFAHIDSAGRALLAPPQRKVRQVVELSYRTDEAAPAAQGNTPAEIWYALGLIDEHAHPTRRGQLFSFFNQGEGLALAAALEEPSYPVEELILDLANLRAGHRFEAFEQFSARFGNICRQTYGEVNYPGYLRKGLPENYGDGAAEVLFGGLRGRSMKQMGEELLSGDVERARVEWRSLLHHIVNAPFLDWDRWLELKEAATERVSALPRPFNLDTLPPLTHLQSRRHKSFLRFD
jgi:superfamily II DNA/RNA helicase